MALTCIQVLLMVGMLVTGSINTISKKAQNDCRAQGYPDKSANGTSQEHDFDHPWFQTWLMFIGETLCLIGLFAVRRKEMKVWRNLNAWSVNVETSPVPPPSFPRVFQWVFLIPTVCDLIGTSLAGIGLLYVDASVWQMLRGSIIIFAGILSKIFLKRKLVLIHWCGMLLVMVGLVLVGCSSVFKSTGGNHGSQALLGIALILGSQLVSASQMVIEETFLKNKNFHPLQVVGMEGTFGFLLMSFAVLPVMYFVPGPQVNNSYENSLDALYQISNSTKLLILSFLYLSSIAFYNYFGLSVTKSLTAVHRTLIDACRTIMVWVVDLFIYYVFDKNFGEPFDTQYGLLQLDGFVFLMIGTALYNGLIDLSFISCCRKSMQEMRNMGRNQTIQDDDSASSDEEEEPLIREQPPVYS